MKAVLARLLRTLADRLDRRGAPKGTHCSFTIEPGIGIVVHEDHRGCPIWYYGDDAYKKAWKRS